MVGRSNIGIMALCVFVVSSAWAGFEINEEENETCFGSAQNHSFKRAISGDMSLDSYDKSFLANLDANRVNNRWRIKMLIGRPACSVSPEIFLKSLPATSPNFYAPPGVNKKLVQLILGWGYKGQRWASDLELCSGEQINTGLISAASTTPALTVAPASLASISGSSNLKYLGVFWNVEYELPMFFDFMPRTIHPYIQAGVGVVFKNVNNDYVINGNVARNAMNLRTVGWSAGIGLRFEVTSQLMGDIAYRLFDFGSVNFAALPIVLPADTLIARGKHFQSRGLYFGLTYNL